MMVQGPTPTSDADAGPSLRGFSLIELLVAIAIIGVIVAIMVPSIQKVRSTTERVVCSSNIRQIGLGLAVYADAYKGFVPPSIFAGADAGGIDAPQETVRLRLGSDIVSALSTASKSDIGRRDAWDGLGVLFRSGTLDAPGIFYCPAHRGDHPFDLERDRWNLVDQDLVGNYQYRAAGPRGERRLWNIQPRASVLVSDSLRPEDVLNHEDGANVLRADLSVLWFQDPGQQLLLLSQNGRTNEAWRELDSFAADGQLQGGP
jgi:prepilin-type N-terminal cleavage/methylation domain-containing protein